jgi:hypothetical protein
MFLEDSLQGPWRFLRFLQDSEDLPLKIPKSPERFLRSLTESLKIPDRVLKDSLRLLADSLKIP